MLIGITLLLTLLSAFFVLVNFIAWLIKGRVITREKIWTVIQVWTVAVLPFLFLSFMDLANDNDCCTDSAIFSPRHRIGIYLLIIGYSIAFVITVFRKRLLAPLAELFVNVFLMLGLILNILFCKQFSTMEEGYLWWIFGNIPILFLLLIALTENQKLLMRYIEENELTANNVIGKLCISILKLGPIYKYPVLAVILVPVIILLSILLLLFGQQPDSMIRAFTDTYKHGFSQLDYLCDNVNCGGHYLCSVAANGHVQIVKPQRRGVRNGQPIICNRQLLVSNAFEDLIQDKVPFLHKTIRFQYNKVGNMVHRYYYVFNNKFVADCIYILMKPLEWFFLLILYSFDQNPENRIAKQYIHDHYRQQINAACRPDEEGTSPDAGCRPDEGGTSPT